MTKPGKTTVEALIASGKDIVTPVVSDYQVSSKEETVQAATSPIVLTIGHSTRTIEGFINLLAHGVSRVVDVRTIPRSRHNPQFNADSLPGSLKKVGVGYVHMAGLGGLRHPARDSLNVGWCNGSFRGFADYMQTLEFETSLDELIQLANRDRIALMCAEAVPWRCHRSLIADALLVRGIHTEHILSLARRQIHTLTRFAKVQGTRITYPAENSPAFQSKPSRKRSRSASESTN
jgi:uncharacterized protein (DUF488 family)